MLGNANTWRTVGPLNEPYHNRRAFLRRSAVAISAAACLAATPKAAQSDPPPQEDPLQYCNPWPVPPSNPVLFVPDLTLPLRERKSAFELNDFEQDRLRRGYTLLRRLYRQDADDPRGWLRQANVHCWYCGGPAGVEINSGPEIHGNWNFLPWHRMYLYFHERILAALLNDPSFALPFWDWDTPGHNQLPPVYADLGTQSDPNSLLDPIRGVSMSNTVPLSIVGPAAIQAMLKPLTTDAFFGTSTFAPTSSAGTAEQSPHGPIHIWTADPTLGQATGNIPLPDMGILATAARDPVFFAHHTNIDRLWDVWLNQPVQPSEPRRTNPMDPQWGAQRFAFYDQRQPLSWVSMAVADTIDHEGSLRYRYLQPTSGSLPRHAAPQLFVAATAKEFSVTPQSNVPATLKIGAAELERLTKQAPARPQIYLLHIEGIEAAGGGQALVRVFVNLPAATAKTDSADSHVVGQFAILAKHAPSATMHAMAMQKHPAQNVLFEISQDRLANLLKGAQELTVKLVPFGADAEKPTQTTLTYKKVYLTVASP
jgi:polyphenol oxidase